MTYGILRFIVLGFLASYLSIGVWSHYSTKGQEDNYPFFSWFLFDKVPPRIQTDFAVRFSGANGQAISPPVYFDKARNLYNMNLHTQAEYSRIIHDLGYSIKIGDNRTTEAIRKTLEASFLVPAVKYEILEIKFDQIERFKSGAVIELTPLTSFTEGIY